MDGKPFHVVSHKMDFLGCNFPELKEGPAGWSLFDQKTHPVQKFVETESCVEPWRYNEFVALNECGLENLYVEETQDDDFKYEFEDMERDMISQFSRMDYQTDDHKMFILAVNTSCSDMYVDYPDELPYVNASKILADRKGTIDDIYCLYQKCLKIKQGVDREIVDEVFLPFIEPFGGTLDEFKHAKFEEESGTRIFGNSSDSYTAWAEINVGRPVFFFSCHSRSGWYNYVYTGQSVRCVSRTMFRGVGFEGDEVIYSLDDYPAILVQDEYKPVLNMKWQKFPIKQQDGLTRVVCKRNGNDHVIVTSVYSNSVAWSSRLTLEQLNLHYDLGLLSPCIASEYKDMQRFDLYGDQSGYTAIELNNMYALPLVDDIQSVAIVPVHDEGNLQCVPEEEKADYCDRMHSKKYYGTRGTAVLSIEVQGVDLNLGIVSYTSQMDIVRLILTNVKGVEFDSQPCTKTHTMVKLRRGLTGFKSEDFRWWYRIVRDNVINEYKGGLKFKLRGLAGFKRTHIKGNVSGGFPATQLYLRTGSCYRQVGLRFLT